MTNTGKNRIMGEIYRPPKNNNYNDSFENLLETILAGHSRHKTCYLMSDFNTDLFKSEFWSKDLPNMNTFCDLLSETIVISVHNSFFRNYISIVLLSSIVLTSQSQRLFT